MSMLENPLEPQLEPAAETGVEPGEGLTRRESIQQSLAAAGALALSTPMSAAPNEGDIQYRIHPAIGVIRVGNANPDDYFLGPEAPGYGSSEPAASTPAPHPFKKNGNTRPQAQRFRVWKYVFQNNRWTPQQEVVAGGNVSISWTVHLANKKASFFRFEGPNGERFPAGARRNAAVIDRNSLNIDFGPRTITGQSTGAMEFSYASRTTGWTCPLNYRNEPVIDYLGQLRTDSQGRLIVIGGKGRAGYQTQTAPDLPSYANNDGWFDDIADGPVTATVTVGNVTTPVADAGKAWVLCAPPDFAPRMRMAVSMYDLLYDMAVRALPLAQDNQLYAATGALGRIRELKSDYIAGADYELPNTTANFDKEIFPILRAAYDYYWVTALVTQKHASLMSPSLGDPSAAAAKDRQAVFSYLRAPLGINAPTGPRSMPNQNGDNPYIGQEPEAIRKATITHVQFALIRRWADGNFTAGSPGTPPSYPALPAYAISPQGLDQAALENCAGGAFFPGIEASWQLRNPALFIEPFRIRHGAPSQYLDQNGALEQNVFVGPGHFSRQMALPWHADFNDCKNEGKLAWWPAQRPDDAFPARNAPQRLDWARPTVKFASGSKTSTHSDMIDNWWKFAFVVQDGDQVVESERAPQIP